TRFQEAIADPEQRKAFVYLQAKFVKSYHFLRCFFTYPYHIGEFADFAESVGPQLVKAGTVSEMMKLVRATTVVRAAVIDQGEVEFAGGTRRPRPPRGGGGGGIPVVRVSIEDMLAKFREDYQVSEDE